MSTRVIVPVALKQSIKLLDPETKRLKRHNACIDYTHTYKKRPIL